LKPPSKRNHATREDWLKAALDALYKQGPEGLNIQALAGQLNISKTSFYWHFKNKAELLDRLIDLWLHEFTETVTENVKLMNSPPRQRLAMAMKIVDEFDLGNYDSSFRVWAKTEPRVARAVREANRRRLEFASKAFAELGFSGDSLACRAALWVGYQSTERYVFPEFSAQKRKALRKERLELLVSGGTWMDARERRPGSSTNRSQLRVRHKRPRQWHVTAISTHPTAKTWHLTRCD
jgi:AcrR family transcriptional regulator